MKETEIQQEERITRIMKIIREELDKLFLNFREDNHEPNTEYNITIEVRRFENSLFEIEKKAMSLNELRYLIENLEATERLVDLNKVVDKVREDEVNKEKEDFENA